ncbi:EAL domain-containing protein [Myxosarcina sp. GI1]|uniref:two-component system response regulator n=1 Tax=Myxosarcina sp. GI1 TaxID=1541065 RepID=UPI00068CE15B|nr:EAL domain-containing protein [Myxosarcina sp. GI1]
MVALVDCKRQKTILLVDDTPDNLQLIFKYLKDFGYKVLVAQSGKKAIKTAKKMLPDLILLDVMMSEINGFETCRHLKADNSTKNIPIIFMTALSETSSKLTGFKLGAVDYITKPIDRQELLARIHTHLSLQNLNRCLALEVKKQKLLFDITDRIRQTLNLQAIFQTATDEILHFLECDRLSLVSINNAIICIEAQSIADNLTASLLPITLDSICPSEEQYHRYLKGKSEIFEYRNRSENLVNIESQLLAVVPILLNQTARTKNSSLLWGWLVAERHSLTKWQEGEINLLQRLTTQLEIAIEQGLLYKRLREANVQLKQLAMCDPLTKIFNRRYFERQIYLEWRRAIRIPAALSLLMCDVDLFKVYNDTYGHQQGDECLRRVAGAIASAVKRPADIVARYGGEEFAVILPHTPLRGAIEVAENIRAKVRELNISHANSSVISTVTLSIGIASTFPNAKDNPALLIEAADRALYTAKSRGRNCISIYRDDISQSKSEQARELQWSKRLRQALQENLFVLYAQPITSLSLDDRKQYFEILLRLSDRHNRVIAPNTFLDIANRNFLMPNIDTWVVENVLATLASGDRCNWENHRFSINLSGASLNDENFLKFLTTRLKDYQLPPQLFCFEITETIAISNLNSVSTFIKTLKDLGCSFALDDFGKGMSSLTYLKNLSVDYLKIDGSFIRALDRDNVSRAMVEAINNLAQVIGLKTVAEFVENQDILDALRALKVDYAQGYHLGRPEKFTNLLLRT